MDADWTPWLREQPASWPQRGDEQSAGPARWQREPEPFEAPSDAEMYPAATALDDLVSTDERAEITRILARYTVLRVLILSAAGWLAGARLRAERRIALEHLLTLPPHDWERRALERLNSMCRETPAPALVAAVTTAAESAAKRGHSMGAFGLYRAAFDIARRRAWWAQAADAARGASRLARLEEAPFSERLWARRARVLDRRAQRALQSPGGPGSDADGRRL